MKLLSLFRRQGSAPQARERLQILLSHERAAGRQPDLLAILQEEILATIARQITVERENVRVRIDRGATVSTLEIDVDIPHATLIATVYLHIVFGDAAAFHADTLDATPDRYTRNVRVRLEMARYVTAEDYVKALDGRRTLAHDFAVDTAGHPRG